MGKILQESKKFPPQSAGRISEATVPTVHRDLSIKDVVDYLRRNIHNLESVNYIYITDKKNKLVGVMSIKDILRQDESVLIKKVMKSDFIKVHPFTHQEKVAYLALKHNLKALPVVAKNGIFIGAVLSDTILNVLQHEMQRDLSNMSGAPNFPAKDITNIPLKTILAHRLPWLIIGLFGILGAAKIIGFFEGTLAENLILASFIPLIMYMGGSTLSQTESFFIRDLAVASDFKFGRYFLRQFISTSLIALCLSLFAFIINIFLIGELKISYVVSLALFLVVSFTTITSLLIPYLFFKLKMDPADGSGPISTIFQDVIGVILYFSIAALLL